MLVQTGQQNGLFLHITYNGASLIKRGGKKVLQNPVSKLSPIFMKNEKNYFSFTWRETIRSFN
jgi:hypothetical protein